MQKVKVADVLVKEGKNDKGTYMQTTVTSDDGTKFSSFADSATSIEVGDLIEIEVVVKGKYNNFTEVKTLEKGAGTPKPAPGSNGQDIKGASIEAQNAYSGVIQLIIHDKIEIDTLLARTALHYALAKLSQWVPEPVSKPITEKAPEGESEDQRLTNLGALLARCSDYGITRKDFMGIVKVTEAELKTFNLTAAAQKIKDHIEENNLIKV